MPNLRAAKKSMRKDQKRQERNVAIKSELKTLIKKLNTLISTDKVDEATKFLAAVMSKLDKAVKKGVIKQHTSDRRKSRLARNLNKTKSKK